MPITVTFFIGCQILSLLVSSIIGLVGVWYLRRALLRTIAASGREQWSPEVYLRFAATNARLVMAVQRMNVITFLIMLLGIVVLAFGFASFRNLILISPLIWAVFIGFLFSSRIFIFVKAIFVDVEVLRITQESNLQRSDAFTLAVKNFLFNWLPALLFQEALGILLLLGVSPIFFLCWFLLFAILKFIGLLFVSPLSALITLWRPIEQTQWAALAPRIKDWARLAGVEFAAVQIQRGGVAFDLIGLGRPTLLISETFLRFSEWRQQDALIGIASGLVRKQIALKSFLRGMLSFAWFEALLVTFLLPASSLGTSIQGIILLAYFVLFMVLAIISQRSLHAASFYADRLAVLLTGDPGAVLVALNTMQALSGLPAKRPLSYNLPRTSDRIKRLKKFARQSWQLAPQSTALVPAITPVSMGTYNLTTSFTQADSPDPVPSAPYADPAKT